MALVLADRVQQTGTANTTVSFTLTGSVTGFQSFAVIGNTNTTYYAATDASGNWEVGLGTYSTTGPTLTRTTVYSSSNSNLAVTFSGAVNVFVTYPSNNAIYEDASGNVSPLGTIASGVWQGTTIGVAYGGTGVTASSGANSVVLRDSNQNIAVNRINQSNTSTAAAAGTTVLTAASSYSQTLTGTGGQTYRMPDATTLTTGVAFVFNNNATGTLTLVDNASGALGTITAGGAAELVLLANGTVAGTWDVHGFLPEAVTWGTNALALGSTVITGGTWNGGTITSAYGGTGLTTFTAANNALYSTSASALAAGTLPAAAGGTGNASYTVGDLLYASTTTALSKLADVATGNALISGGVGVAPSYGKIGLTTHVSGTLPTANGGTGLTSFTANGVVYASSTSALTTGSTLTFDGTTFDNAGGVIRVRGSTASFALNDGTTQSTIGFNGAGSLGFTSAYPIYIGTTANQPLQFNINSAEQMRLTSTGLGIGTSSPVAKLDVYQGTAGTAAAKFLHVNGNAIYINPSYNYYDAYNHIFRSLSGTTTYATIDNSGNVGIGTTAPSVKLDVVGTTTSAIRLRSSSGASNGFNLYNDSTNDTAYLMNFFSGSMVFGTANTERFRIGSAGQLGIGGANYGTSGQVLTSGGSGAAPSWTTVSGGQYYGTAAVKAIAYNSDTIGENITIPSGQNGLSAGPVTVSTGFSVTVNGNWVIV